MGCGFIDEAFWIAMQIMCEKQKKEYIDPSEVTALELEHGERTSLADLKYFPNLRHLALIMADLENLDELATLPKLKSLKLEVCEIEDASAVWELHNLSRLEICFSSLGGRKQLSKLNQLKRLTLSFMDLPEWASMSVLDNLEELTLQECGLTDISFLSPIKKLRRINLSQNHITDISVLQRMENLESVCLWGNKITDLSPLRILPKIKRLWLGMNPIDWSRCSLGDLECIPNIVELSVDETGPGNSMIACAKRVKRLYLGGKNCTDISFLKELKNVEIAELAASAVKDIYPVLELPKLKRLWLVNNVFITDYHPVHVLRNAGKKVSISRAVMDIEYVELRIHTQHSNTGSIISPCELWDYFRNREIKAIAITDYNSVGAFFDIERLFQGLAMKIIFGLETRTEKANITLLAKNRLGVKKLYQIVLSLDEDALGGVAAHEWIISMRDDLLIGSACESGALAKAISEGKSWDELTQIAAEFDYLEISPVFAEDTVRTIIKLGQELSIPVCAVSDARFIKPEDEYLLRLHNGSTIEPPRYLHGKYSKNLLFSYLDEDTRDEIILRNPAMVADMTETISLFESSAFDADAAVGL